jgi:hypothetical protein
MGWQHIGRAGTGLLALVLATAALVACSKESAAERAERLVLGVAEATFDEGTAQVAITLDGLGDLEGPSQVDFEAFQSEASLDLDQGTTSVFLDTDSVLVQVDDVLTVLDPDDLDPLGPAAALLLGMLPAQIVQVVPGYTGDIDIDDDTTIDGVDVHHYKLRVDVDRILDLLDGDARDVMAAVLATIGEDRFDIEVWIDDDGRLIQAAVPLEVDGEPVVVTLGFSDFGSDVEIEIPDATEALSTEDFGLATADVTGTTFTGELRVVSSTLPAWLAPGPFDDVTITLRCRPNGNCVNTEEGGGRFRSAGPGSWTVSTDELGDCTDTLTGAVTAPGGGRSTSEVTWTVSAYEDGQATELTATGTAGVQITPAGQATGCTITGQPGSATSATAQLEGTATSS